ncbi:hypothetical protein FKW77_000418 [Venturia effusa]|uniref:Uncharacterized protein n=1 Tax=Venturia effusa TaxID=50376 RepID=A0A517LM12_9PEZI|nr:hypothetical protein FKW77_000418 [Venturia effusa]
MSIVLLPAALALPAAEDPTSVTVSKSEQVLALTPIVGSGIAKRSPTYSLASSEKHDVEYRRY